MGLSSNIVWHQTNYEGLKSIINSKSINYSYSLETINWKGNSRDIAFPVISFCDIPLSDISEYLGKYGKYTIGFRREWGKKIRLSPVWYRDKDATSLREQMDSFKMLLSKEPFLLTESEKELWQTIAYTKNHDGKLLKYKFESYRFYDERELRLVPTYSELCDAHVFPYLSKDDYVKYKQFNGSSLIKELKVEFEYTDISYMLVSSKSQINRVKRLFGTSGTNIIFMSYDQVIKDIVGNSHNIDI